MEKLKNCPFCGGKAIIMNSKSEGKYKWKWVRCDSCTFQTSAYFTAENAIAAWNRRAE